MNSRNIIVIGAPRSGTNMLRDILTSFKGISTWPCDEINYIWRYGNASYPSDEIPPELATTAVKKYIRKKFLDIQKKYNSQIVVEKTCASSLRIPFINVIFPDAKYIFIYRDGIDVTGSAKDRWTADLNLSYLLKKIQFVPIRDMPYYGLRYIWARIYRFFSKENRLAFWGPAFDNMQTILNKFSLDEACALQWQHCVEKANKELSVLPHERVCRVKYESFVRDPKNELLRILNFVGFDTCEQQLEQAILNVSEKSIGKGHRLLEKKEVQNLQNLIGDTLSSLGYLPES